MGAVEGRLAIVVARFNDTITSRLLEGAVRTLAEHGIAEERIDVFWTPGAFEIPTVAGRLVRAGEHAAIIAAARSIRGETTHDRHINRAVQHCDGRVGARTGCR